MNSCRCNDYKDLDDQPALNKRGHDTKRIADALQLIAEHPQKEHRLYRCSACGQMWHQFRSKFLKSFLPTLTMMIIVSIILL
jgi:hypothetical protein